MTNRGCRQIPAAAKERTPKEFLSGLRQLLLVLGKISPALSPKVERYRLRILCRIALCFAAFSFE